MRDAPTLLSIAAAETDDRTPDIVAEYMRCLSEAYSAGGPEVAQALLTALDEQAKAAKDEERSLLNLVVWSGCMAIFVLEGVLAHPEFKSRRCAE